MDVDDHNVSVCRIDALVRFLLKLGYYKFYGALKLRKELLSCLALPCASLPTDDVHQCFFIFNLGRFRIIAPRCTSDEGKARTSVLCDLVVVPAQNEFLCLFFPRKPGTALNITLVTSGPRHCGPRKV